TLRSIPARSISRWLASAASAGVSLTVLRWNCDRRIVDSAEWRGNASFCHAPAAARSVGGGLRCGSGGPCAFGRGALHPERRLGQRTPVGALGLGQGLVGFAVAVAVHPQRPVAVEQRNVLARRPAHRVFRRCLLPL